MKNLAGVKEADYFIQEELFLAGIEIVKEKLSAGEVPYSLTGKFGNWVFIRCCNYWSVKELKDKGLPLDVAIQLHEKKYPILGKNMPKIFGDVVRVMGYASCPHPSNYSNHYDDQGFKLVIDPYGKQEHDCEYLWKKFPGMRETLNKLRFVKSLEGIIVNSFVSCYHIDTQIGLNEFVKVVKTLILE